MIFLVASQAHAERSITHYTVSSVENETIKGNVVNQEGKAVEGAKVTVVETGETAVTDALGNFSISAQIGQTLSILADKYEIQSTEILDTSITIELEPKLDSLDLQEVTLVGYGSQKKI